MYIDQDEVIDIALLYEAGLGRQYDDYGLNYWIDTYEYTPLDVIAYNFLVSDEFTVEFGPAYSIETEVFVDAMYDNVLSRDPDPSGFDYWVSLLDSGAADRDDVLIAFSQSPENYSQSPYVYELYEVSPGFWDF